MRSLEVWAADSLPPRERYSADQAMVSRVAQSPRTAILRVSRADAEGLCLGRFHRRDRDADPRLTRRTTGGRSTPCGPGLIELALAVPSSFWLDPSTNALRPEQVLNRVLRPLLALLRGVGVDAFYPGRDLVTVGGRPIAACSFTVFPDGVIMADVCIGVDQALSVVRDRVAEFDPGGVAAIAVDCFDSGIAVAPLASLSSDPQEWARLLAEGARDAWRIPVAAPDTAPYWLGEFTPPDDAAYECFLHERTAPDTSVTTAVSMTMLGVVEASASICDGGVHRLEICGDVIAPAATLSALSEACEGLPAAPAALRRAVTSVLAEQRHFVLGLDGLEDLLCRLL